MAQHRIQLASFAEGDVDEVLLYMNSTARLTIALNQGDAAGRLTIEVGKSVQIRPT